MPSKLPSKHGVHPQRKSHLFRHFVNSEEKDLGNARPKGSLDTQPKHETTSLRKMGSAVREIREMLYKIPAVANALGVSKSTVNRLIASGEIRTIQIRKAVRISEEQLTEFITRSEVKR